MGNTQSSLSRVPAEVWMHIAKHLFSSGPPQFSETDIETWAWDWCSDQRRRASIIGSLCLVNRDMKNMLHRSQYKVVFVKSGAKETSLKKFLRCAIKNNCGSATKAMGIILESRTGLERGNMGQVCPNLTHLYLHTSGDRCTSILDRLTITMPSITHLDLEDNDFGWSTFKKLPKIFPTLKSLNIVGSTQDEPDNRTITFPHLTYLYLFSSMLSWVPFHQLKMEKLKGVKIVHYKTNFSAQYAAYFNQIGHQIEMLHLEAPSANLSSCLHQLVQMCPKISTLRVDVAEIIIDNSMDMISGSIDIPRDKMSHHYNKPLNRAYFPITNIIFPTIREEQWLRHTFTTTKRVICHLPWNYPNYWTKNRFPNLCRLIVEELSESFYDRFSAWMETEFADVEWHVICMTKEPDRLSCTIG